MVNKYSRNKFMILFFRYKGGYQTVLKYQIRNHKKFYYQ